MRLCLSLRFLVPVNSDIMNPADTAHSYSARQFLRRWLLQSSPPQHLRARLAERIRSRVRLPHASHDKRLVCISRSR